MKPTEELVTEHEAVLVALQLLERIEGAIVKGQREAPEHLRQLIDFFRGFVDGCHHSKEEEILFPELQRRGVKLDWGPIGVMLKEHEAGRRHIRGMSDGLERLKAGDPAAAAVIRENAQAYRELLRAHIQKENEVLFPMADRLVPSDAAATMAARFEAIEREKVGEGKHEAFHAMLHQLAKVYGI